MMQEKTLALSYGAVVTFSTATTETACEWRKAVCAEAGGGCESVMIGSKEGGGSDSGRKGYVRK